VVSGLDKPTDKLKAYKLGISDYLVKPVDDEKLVKAIEKAIELKSG
jgi:CheY-like chemotaxis protein